MRTMNFAVLLSSVLISSVCVAQQPVVTPATTVTPATSVPAAPGALTEESLGNLIAAMGLKPKKEESRYDFEFKALVDKEEWVLSMSSVLSADGTSVWVMAWLDELPKSAGDVPRTALLRLLARNDKLGNGKFFAYIAANRRFVMQRVVPNQNMSTAAFRDVLKDLGQSVVETYPEWAVSNWNLNTTDPSVETISAQKEIPVTK